jgi:hypothetical protein
MKKENNFHGYGKNLSPHHIYESNHLYHSKIINEKETKVFTQEDMLDSNNDENSLKVSLETTT